MADTAVEPATGMTHSAVDNGTHPDGVDPDEAARAAAQLIGLAEGGQLSFAVGGKKPDESKLKLAGRSISVPGAQLSKGEELTIQCRIRVGEIHFIDKVDSATEQVVGCTRKQVARIVGDVSVVD